VAIIDDPTEHPLRVGGQGSAAFRCSDNLNTVPVAVTELPDGALAVRRARLAAGLSLRALAARVGVSAATLSAIEHGHTRLSVDRLQRVADAVGASASDLLVPSAPRFGAVSAGAVARSGPLVTPSADEGAWRRFEPIPLGPVVAAAVEAFVETGYHGATVRDIAARAGMSVSGLYHHHRSKQELLVIIFEVTMADLRWRVEAARDSAEVPAERVAAVVEALALYHVYRRDLAFIGASEMRSLEPRARRRIAALRNRVQHVLDHEIDAATGPGADTHAAHLGARAIATMCTSLPQWFRVGGPTTPEQLAVRYADHAFALLGLPSRPH
jgi:AcrR family transcriptional regulator/DNA-binding XRE family transcriptional regulator